MPNRSSATISGSTAERGQALVLMTVSVAALLALTALVIDGGNAMAQQRATQNGADAAALAGATVIVEGLGAAQRSDADVYNAVTNSLASNSTTLNAAEYVDFSGNTVGTVGGGHIPFSAYGIRVAGTRSFSTYLAGIAGLATMNSGAQAVAMTGALQGVCDARDGCAVAPVAFSIPIRVCDGSNKPLQIGIEWPLVDMAVAEAGDTSLLSIVPLCTSGPGGVGWLDFGTAEVGCSGTTLGGWISNPCNKSFEIPVWLKSKAGDHNDVDNAFQPYRGQLLLIPMFDSTCKAPPTSGQPADCTDPGSGDNLYYHIPQFAAFVLYESHTTGNNNPQCNRAPGQPPAAGNGATTCLKGWFVNFIKSGTVGLPRDCRIENGDRVCGDPVFGIQLVR